MSTEQRVISTKPKVGPRGGAAATAAAQPAATDPAPRRGRGRVITLVVAALLLVGGGAGYWFLVGPGAATDAAAVEVEPEPEHGEVLPVEPVSINLAGGRYLRVGLGLQLPAEVEEELDPSKAIDLAISLFSGRSIEEVGSAEGRVLLKAELTRQLQEAYHGEVLEVFFTEYVTQ